MIPSAEVDSFAAKICLDKRLIPMFSTDDDATKHL